MVPPAAPTTWVLPSSGVATSPHFVNLQQYLQWKARPVIWHIKNNSVSYAYCLVVVQLHLKPIDVSCIRHGAYELIGQSTTTANDNQARWLLTGCEIFGKRLQIALGVVCCAGFLFSCCFSVRNLDLCRDKIGYERTKSSQLVETPEMLRYSPRSAILALDTPILSPDLFASTDSMKRF